MDRSPRPFLVSPGESEPIRGRFGLDSVVLARAENTGGMVGLPIHKVPPKAGPLLHIHAKEDEMRYVLEGEFRFKADDDIFRAPAGSFMFVPRGISHAPPNVRDVPSRYLEMFIPAGMERFFEELSRKAREHLTPERYRSIAERASMRVVGPPLSESDPL